MKNVFFKISQNSQENNCARAFFVRLYNCIKKETLAQVFSCEFCKTLNNTFFTEHLQATAPILRKLLSIDQSLENVNQ